MVHGTSAEAVVAESGFENDWNGFVQALALLLAQGHSDREISEHFTEKSMVWTGRITNLALTRALAQSVSLGMGTPRVELSDGRYISADHIVLHFRDDIPSGWDQRKIGDLVKFKAQFKVNSGVQAAIVLSESRDEGMFSLRLGLERGTFLEMLES